MSVRRCLECGIRIPSGSRCARHADTHERSRRRGRRQPWYGGDWRKVSKRAREEHVARHGLTCPGYGVPAHRVDSIDDLTLDHVTPRSTSGGLQVLCRSCNGRKGGSDDRKRDH